MATNYISLDQLKEILKNLKDRESFSSENIINECEHQAIVNECYKTEPLIKAQLEKITLLENDLLVCHCLTDVSYTEIDGLLNMIENEVKNLKCKIIILNNQAKLEKFSDEQLIRIGLQRIEV